MVIHTFAIRYQPQTTQQQKDRALADILDFAGKVPGLLHVHAGKNFSTRANGFEHGAVMQFTDRAALESYVTSPLHLEFLAWVEPLIAAAQDVDFGA